MLQPPSPHCLTSVYRNVCAAQINLYNRRGLQLPTVRWTKLRKYVSGRCAFVWMWFGFDNFEDKQKLEAKVNKWLSRNWVLSASPIKFHRNGNTIEYFELSPLLPITLTGENCMNQFWAIDISHFYDVPIKPDPFQHSTHNSRFINNTVRKS